MPNAQYLLCTAHIALHFTCAVFTSLLLEPFSEPQMSMNSVFLYKTYFMNIISMIFMIPWISHSAAKVGKLQFQYSFGTSMSSIRTKVIFWLTFLTNAVIRSNPFKFFLPLVFLCNCNIKKSSWLYPSPQKIIFLAACLLGIFSDLKFKSFQRTLKYF